MSALRIRLAIARHVLWRLGPPLIAVVVYTLLATVLVRWDLSRAGLLTGDFQQSAYGIYTQLFFEPTEVFPVTPVARTVFWITPLVGVILIAQGVVKVGASLFDLAARRELWVRIVSEQMRDHVVVCGLGHVGYRVVEELHRLKQPVVALERREDESFLHEVRELGVPVHLGDARRDEVLAATGIARARAVVCATNDDMVNVEVALDAKRMNPSIRVIMRMFDQRLARKVGGALELDESFSTSALAAPLVAIQATHPGVLSAYRVAGAVRVTAEIEVGRDGSSVADIEASLPCRVVARLASGAHLAAHAQDAVSKGERLVIDVAAGDLAKVRAALA
ncbi:MAG: NAD-binding protein [Deltaproteobacteria bacterium]|nr:NAD-binding protein [Deltaproteobacteria bacterium]